MKESRLKHKNQVKSIGLEPIRCNKLRIEAIRQLLIYRLKYLAFVRGSFGVTSSDKNQTNHLITLS